MKNIVVLAGLPCSGKTTLGNMLRNKILESIFIDDVSVFYTKTSLIECLRKMLLEYNTVVIADVYLAFKENKTKATEIIREYFKEVNLVWIELRIDKETLIKRFYKRNDGRKVLGLIEMVDKHV